jgi:hypothetical protein
MVYCLSSNEDISHFHYLQAMVLLSVCFKKLQALSIKKKVAKCKMLESN